jgi:hypothetical protein
MEAPWSTVTINNLKEFESAVEKLTYRKWVFRGQSDSSYGIKSSLYRLFEDFQAIFREYKGRKRKFAKDKHEGLLIDRFQASAHLYIDYLPESDDLLEWCAIMQHYGAPTRLIDVTFSPFIALYFALESGYKDCSVFAFNYEHFTSIDQEILETKNYSEFIFKSGFGSGNEAFFIPYEPKRVNPRLMAQQGLFLVPSTNYQTLDKIISLYEDCDKACIKYIIPANLRYEGIKLLRRMNITASVLFPGIDGFCRSLRYQVVDTVNQLKRIGESS